MIPDILAYAISFDVYKCQATMMNILVLLCIVKLEFTKTHTLSVLSTAVQTVSVPVVRWPWRSRSREHPLVPREHPLTPRERSIVPNKRYPPPSQTFPLPSRTSTRERAPPPSRTSPSSLVNVPSSLMNILCAQLKNPFCISYHYHTTTKI